MDLDATTSPDGSSAGPPAGEACPVSTAKAGAPGGSGMVAVDPGMAAMVGEVGILACKTGVAPMAEASVAQAAEGAVTGPRDSTPSPAPVTRSRHQPPSQRSRP